MPNKLSQTAQTKADVSIFSSSWLSLIFLMADLTSHDDKNLLDSDHSE